MKRIKIIIETARKLLTEFMGLVLVFILFLISPIILRYFDPTAGAYDVGVLQIFLFAVMGVLFFSFLSWVGTAVNFPSIFKYMQGDLFNDFKELEKWQKIKLCFFVYFFYLLLFVVSARIL